MKENIAYSNRELALYDKRIAVTKYETIEREYQYHIFIFSNNTKKLLFIGYKKDAENYISGFTMAIKYTLSK